MKRHYETLHSDKYRIVVLDSGNIGLIWKDKLYLPHDNDEPMLRVKFSRVVDDMTDKEVSDYVKARAEVANV